MSSTELIAWLATIWQWIFAAASLIISLIGAGHALLNKREAPASFGWVGACLLLPVLGAALYYLFGVNRIRTRIADHRREPTPPDSRQADVSDLSGSLAGLARLGGEVSGFPLVEGNAVAPLFNGDEAFPDMLAAIAGAERSVCLTTYIFETNATGRAFVDALADASDRGVDVRVIVDGFGELYDWPSARRLLAKRGVMARRFLPPRLIPPSVHVNLRNHRKILVVDGVVAYTGGMNLGDRHLVHGRPGGTSDVHFRLAGPIVGQIEAIFMQDWCFLTGELTPPDHAPSETAGAVRCRAIADGPDENLDKLRLVLHGALMAAERRIRLMTPYFLPSTDIVAALETAALGGVEVEVLLPEHSNLPFVDWASRNVLWQLVQRGIRIYLQPPPFAHSKYLVIDDDYTLVGSANIDPRSLRLNFELGIEVFAADVVGRLAQHFDEVRGCSRIVTAEELRSRSLPIRLRDSLAWLASPYL